MPCAMGREGCGEAHVRQFTLPLLWRGCVSPPAATAAVVAVLRVRVRVPNTKIARSRCCARERRSAMSAVFGDARQRMLCRCMRSCSKKGVCSVSVRRMCEVRVWGRA